MDSQSGCLPFLLALILAIGGLSVAMPMGSSVEVSEPVVIEVPAPSASAGS